MCNGDLLATLSFLSSQQEVLYRASTGSYLEIYSQCMCIYDMHCVSTNLFLETDHLGITGLCNGTTAKPEV